MIYVIAVTGIIVLMIGVITLIVLWNAKKDEDELIAELEATETSHKALLKTYGALMDAHAALGTKYDEQLIANNDLEATAKTFEKFIDREKARKEDYGYVRAVHYKTKDMLDREVLCRKFQKGTRFETASSMALVTCKRCVSLDDRGATRQTPAAGKVHKEISRDICNDADVTANGARGWIRTACGRLIRVDQVHGGEFKPGLNTTNNPALVTCKRCTTAMATGGDRKFEDKADGTLTNNPNIGYVHKVHFTKDGKKTFCKRDTIELKMATSNIEAVTCLGCVKNMGKADYNMWADKRAKEPDVSNKPADHMNVHLQRRMAKLTMCGLKPDGKRMAVTSLPDRVGCPECHRRMSDDSMQHMPVL